MSQVAVAWEQEQKQEHHHHRQHHALPSHTAPSHPAYTTGQTSTAATTAAAATAAAAAALPGSFAERLRGLEQKAADLTAQRDAMSKEVTRLDKARYENATL